MLAYSYIQEICKKSMKSSPHVFFSFTFFFLPFGFLFSFSSLLFSDAA